MYLLYRLARGAKLESYMPEIAVFVIAVSLISAVPLLLGYCVFLLLFPLIFFLLPLGGCLYYIFLGSFTFLSFPFYAWHYEVFDSSGSMGEWHLAIRFLTTDIASSPDGGIGFIAPFSFFLLVNILGAHLGYWVGKKYEIQFGDGWKVLCGFAGVVCIGVSFIVPHALYERVGVVLSGLGFVLFETIFLSWLIEREFLSWLTRARVATLMFLGGIILYLTPYQKNHALNIVGGQILILFGAIVYVVKVVVAYVRTTERDARAEH